MPPSDLSPTQLTVLHALLRGGGIAAAARLLGARDADIAATLAAAEETLGCRLFDPAAGGLTPTPGALALLPRIEAVLAAMDGLRDTARGIGGGETGRIVLCGDSTLLATVGAEAAARFARLHPGIELSLLEAGPEAMLGAVLDRRADLGLGGGPVHHALLSIEEIGRRPLVCALPPGHALARLAGIGPAELRDEPPVTCAPGTPAGLALAQACAAAGCALRPRIVLPGTPAVLDMVARGLGPGIVDRAEGLAAAWPGLVWRPFLPRTETVARLLMPRGVPLSAPVETMAALLRRVAAEPPGPLPGLTAC